MCAYNIIALHVNILEAVNMPIKTMLFYNCNRMNAWLKNIPSCNEINPHMREFVGRFNNDSVDLLIFGRFNVGVIRVAVTILVEKEPRRDWPHEKG